MNAIERLATTACWQRKNLARIAVIVAACGGVALTDRASVGQELLPDMVPWVREDSDFLVNWDIVGGELRVRTMFANIGDGLFQIRTDNAGSGGATTQVTQRVFIGVDNGPNFVDYDVNSAVNFHHSHGHIHFEDFSEFQLLEALIDPQGVVTVGDLVANEVKTSFFLHDSAPIPDPQYAGYVSYPSSNMGRFQNVSAGWGDIYSHGTEGQSISLAGVPFGPLYWLRQIVDPTNVIREKDDSNNSFEILIDLNEQGAAITRLNGLFVQPGDSMPLPPGDLTGDRVVDLADWLALKANATADLLDLDDEQAYMLGDLNFDRQHTLADIVLFRQHFDDANGSGAFAQMLAGGGVPEPAAAVLVLIAVAGLAAIAPRRRAMVLAAILAVSVLWGGVDQPIAIAKQTLFYEDFDSLPLGPPVHEPLQNPNAWTDTPPAGWTVDDSGVPSVGIPSQGVREWEGWSFANKNWWTATAFDQGRASFTLGQGTVAVADPDEWDDLGLPASGANFIGYFNALMTTPAVDLSSISAGSARLTFVSSWLPECCDDGPTNSNNQTARIRASFDGGETFSEVMRWESTLLSPFYKDDATNERVLVELDNPLGAPSVILEFGLLNAGNDWWWAIDQVEVFTPTELRVDTASGAMTIVGANNLSGYEIASSGHSLNPAGWQAGNLDAQNYGSQPPLTADFNNDHTVGAADYVVWRNSEGVDSQGDATGDGVTDAEDYAVWVAEYGRAVDVGASWETVIALDDQLLEFFLTGSSSFAERSIGTGYDTVMDGRDLVFTYSTADGQEFAGIVTYIGGDGAQSAVPEPGMGVLCIIGAAAMLLNSPMRRG